VAQGHHCLSRILQSHEIVTLLKLSGFVWTVPFTDPVSPTRTEYFISGREESQRGAEIEYRIHLLRLREDESQKVQLNPSYVPTPILEERLNNSFRVSSSTVVKYAIS